MCFCSYMTVFYALMPYLAGAQYPTATVSLGYCALAANTNKKDEKGNPVFWLSVK